VPTISIEWFGKTQPALYGRQAVNGMKPESHGIFWHSYFPELPFFPRIGIGVWQQGDRTISSPDF
jgi:hypothetical protein